MKEYVDVFEWIVLIVDVLILIGCTWTVYRNGYALVTYNEGQKDVPLRGILLILCSYFLHANWEAMQRHIDSFIVLDKVLDIKTIESLLSDRGGMMFVQVCLIILTCKWSIKWFE